MLTSVDPFAIFAPVLDPRFRYRGEVGVATLDLLPRRIGPPATIRVVQGRQFITRGLVLWACPGGVMRGFSRPHSAIGCNVPIDLHIPMVQPARHRAQGREVPAPDGLRSGSNARRA